MVECPKGLGYGRTELKYKELIDLRRTERKKSNQNSSEFEHF